MQTLTLRLRSSMRWLWRKILFHRYALVVGIFVAFVAGSPQIIARQMIGSDDRGIPYLIYDAEAEYLARIQEILDGHWSVSSPVLFEYKEAISMMPPISEFIFYIAPLKLTGLSLASVIFLSRFLYPALLYIFAYLFVLSLLTRKDMGARITAIAGACLIVIGYGVTNLQSLISYINDGAVPLRLVWDRLAHPITGAILLFAFLWLLSRIVNEKSRWFVVGISGLVLASMSGYIFSFALGLAIPVILGLYFIWRKNWKLTIRIYTPVVIALALNATYFLGVFLAMRGATSLSDPLKSGMYLTNEPVINLMALLALFVVTVSFALFFRKDTTSEQEKRWWFFSLATALAAVAVYVQQSVTGKTIAPQHFVYYTKPLAMVMGVVFLHNILRSRVRYIWYGATVLIFCISLFFSWRFVSAVRFSIPLYTDLQSFSGVFDYLNAHAEKDCVVYVGSDYENSINRFIPAFTGCNNYYSFYIYNGVPAERVMHNFLVNLRLRGVKPKEVEAHVNANRRFVQGYFFRNWGDMFCCGDRWLKQVGDKNEIDRWFASVGKDVEGRYREYLKSNLYEQLIRYRLDYFVVDVEKQPQINEKNYPFLLPQEKFGRFLVYAMMKPQ